MSQVNINVPEYDNPAAQLAVNLTSQAKQSLSKNAIGAQLIGKVEDLKGKDIAALGADFRVPHPRIFLGGCPGTPKVGQIVDSRSFWSKKIDFWPKIRTKTRKNRFFDFLDFRGLFFAYISFQNHFLGQNTTF